MTTESLQKLAGYLEDKLESSGSKYKVVIQSHEKLCSPYFLYNELLLSLNKQSSDLKDAFKRQLTEKLPESILEKENLMVWICRLEQMKMLSIDDLTLIKAVLKSEKMMLLLEDFTLFEHQMMVMKILSQDLMCQHEKNIDLFDKEKRCFAGTPSRMLTRSFEGKVKEIKKFSAEELENMMREVRRDLVDYSKNHDNEDVAYNCIFLSHRIIQKFGKWLIKSNQTINISADDKNIPGILETLKSWFYSVILVVINYLLTLHGPVRFVYILLVLVSALALIFGLKR